MLFCARSDPGIFVPFLWDLGVSRMAGNRIKGITVEIGGDTTKLQTALKGVNTEIRNTQSQLKDVEKLLKLDPGNTELIAQKHRLLAQAVSETREKLETLKTAQQQADEHCGTGRFPRISMMPCRGRLLRRSRDCGVWKSRRTSLRLRCRRSGQPVRSCRRLETRFLPWDRSCFR